jgi:aryl-alcohol dehydrogenase
MQVRAALLTRAKAPLEIEMLELEEPLPDEVLIEVAAAGVGHADVLAQSGAISVPLPAILGCEGAGSIVRVGRHVGALAPGDRVVLAPHACGFAMPEAGGAGPRAAGMSAFSRAGGRVAAGPLGQSLFATHAVVRANHVVRVTNDLPWQLLALLGGEVLAGATAVMETLRPRPGDGLAIYGAGATGLGALMAAKLAGCHPIIVVDVKASRLELAESLGATMTIDPDGLEPVAAIRGITDSGVAFSLDTTGLPAVVRQAVDCLAQDGVCALTVLAAQDAQLSLDMNHLLRGRTVRGTPSPDGMARERIARLIDFYQRGQFPADRLIRDYPFEDVNRAVVDVATGAAVKPVLLMR